MRNVIIIIDIYFFYFIRFFGDFVMAANSGYVLSEFLDMWQKVGIEVGVGGL